MRLYLATQIQEATDPQRAGLGAFLGVFWATLKSQAGLFVTSSPVLWLFVLWLLRWVLGTSLALVQKNLDTAKAAHSVARWVLWMVALGIAYAVSQFGFYGDDLVGGALGGIVLLTEASGCAKCAARWAKHLGFRDAEKVLGIFATTVEARVEDLEDSMSAGEERSEKNKTRGETNQANIVANSKALHQDITATSALVERVEAIESRPDSGAAPAKVGE